LRLHRAGGYTKPQSALSKEQFLLHQKVVEPFFVSLISFYIPLKKLLLIKLIVNNIKLKFNFVK